jgi:hypothetical protein
MTAALKTQRSFRLELANSGLPLAGSFGRQDKARHE